MTDKYQDLSEAISNAEFSDDAYWLDRYRGESGPETIRGLLAERDAMVGALDLALEYWKDRQQRYKNRRPKWVIAAESAIAAHRSRGEV